MKVVLITFASCLQKNCSCFLHFTSFLLMHFVFLMTDSVYNLREENKQLRKAHHDIHTQLQDAQVRQNLLNCMSPLFVMNIF